MNWQHLTYFSTVAESENFTKTAQRLYMTPSALSRAISALEEELGVPLFVKSGRNSVLTEYGKVFKNYVDQAMECIDKGTQAVQEKAEVMKGQLTIAGIHTMCVEYLPNLVKGFLRLYPNVSVMVGCNICVKILDQVLTGEVDIGFASDYDPALKKYQNLERILLKEEKFVIATSHSHPLAERTHIRFEEMEPEAFIINKNPESKNRAAFYEACGSCRFTPKLAFELPDDQCILGMVAAGLGVTFMADVPSMYREDLHIIQIDGLPIVQHQYLVWKKNARLSYAAERFKCYIESMITAVDPT